MQWTPSLRRNEAKKKEMESNGVANESIPLERKQTIVSYLCKRFSLDPLSFSGESIRTNDVRSLFSNILKVSGNGVPLKKNDEVAGEVAIVTCPAYRKLNSNVMKWVEFADSFPVDSEACHEVLKGLNEDLAQKSVLLGNGLTPSEADIVVFSALHSFVSGLSITDRQKYPNVLRWIDYIQNKEDFGEVFEKIPVEKTGFEPQASKNVGKAEPVPNLKKGAQCANIADKLEADSNLKKSDKVEADSNPKKVTAEKKVVGNSKASEEKKKLPEKESVEKDTETSVSLLNIQVGLIHKAWKHPSADSLLVEEIDLGDGNVRQVVSGLAKYCSPEDLMNRRVVLITNVKPGKLRDVMSAGLVLCASNQDHTVVEPLLPPEGAKIGECVSFSGHDGKPEDVLNPKKKQLEKITPHLYTDEKGVATFKGIPFMTSAGPCTSSIPKASIK